MRVLPRYQTVVITEERNETAFVVSFFCVGVP